MYLLISMFDKTFFLIFVLQSVLAQPREATCTPGEATTNCKAGECNVWINGKDYCSGCAINTEFLINGACTNANDDSGEICTAPSQADGTCASCKEGYFLHEGGCYKIAQEPGSFICSSAGGAGLCSACKNDNGFFKNPSAADATKQSCIACNRTEPIDNVKGVDGCTVCNGPSEAGSGGNPKITTCQTCSPTEDQTERIVKTANEVTSCVTEAQCTAEEGFFVDNNGGKKCTECAGDCKTCKGGANKCTSCKPETNPYWKQDNNLDTGTCVNAEQCTGTNEYYTDDAEPKSCKPCREGGVRDCTKCEKVEENLVCKECPAKFGLGKKSCIEACPENSTESDEESKKVCKCNADFKPSEDFTECIVDSVCKTPYCKTCSNEVCTACAGGYYLTPTNQCISDCTTIKGYYGDTDKKCKACNSECAECVGAASTQCSACRAGKMLQYAKPDSPAEGGTCVGQCTTSSQVTGCKTCGAKIGGTDYCSQCKGEQVPINGVCADNSAASRANICTSDNNGGCTGCANGYFLFASGCYKIGQQPGKQVCAQADGSGECQKCANGLQARGGDCSTSTCHSTCATCSAADQEDKCTTCATGHYKTAQEGICASCENSNGDITGVKNCLDCAPPSSGSGSVLCYLMKGGDNTGGDSTNKSGLSTGAIAGISVAVVVVVGGLVGFLCWWFLCRGKA